jgi:ATP-dependent Clp protease ATP-binding subunit ClpB
MSTPATATTHDHLIRGHEYLEQYPHFELVGRDDILRKLTGILMRKQANNVLLIGTGGVGCSAICLGLQQSKTRPDAPFDIVSKRFFWLDGDWLFSSGDPESIRTGFERALRTLSRTADAVLVIDDMRDFIDAVRNNGCTHLINALMRSLKRRDFQVIMETRDEDLEAVLKCHSDMQENYTMLDVGEPDEELLYAIVSSAAERRLTRHHRVRISDAAITAAIDVTSKYRIRDMGLSRAQPERSLTLLDRALTSYRLNSHARDPAIEAIEQQSAEIEAGIEAGTAAPDATAKLDALAAESERLSEAWSARQGSIQRIYSDLRAGEEAMRDLELEIDTQLERERAKLEGGEDAAAETAEPARKKAYLSFAARTAGAGYDSDAVAELKTQLGKFEAEVAKNKSAFDKLTAEINDSLELAREHVLSEFSSISGIPVSKLTQDERAKLKNLDGNLANRVFGQDHAVSLLANQVRVARAGLQSPNKPQAAFMFLGPSGVGKTELAKALTAELFDDERSLLRFDMSEYMEKHAVAKLIGAPPGYEGYEAGGILTNEMRRNPRRILLFDEIEKAHADIFHVFLQILDDARLTDNRGLTVSFRDAIILMTTNIGTAHFLSESDFAVAEGLAKGDLDEHYRPEFLARFNGKRNIVCFRTLDLPVIEKIAARDIQRLNEMVQQTLPDLSVQMEPRALAAMCRDHYRPVNGARGITGYIEGVIKPEIANTVLFDTQAKGDIVIGYDEDSASVIVTLPQAQAAQAAQAAR